MADERTAPTMPSESMEDASRGATSNVGKAHEGGGVRADVVRLVREKRYEEALSLLYLARAEDPSDKHLIASIAQIKEFLVGAYAKRLGGLDRIAGPVPVAAGRSPDALLVARYVDGTSSFGDISRTCPLGQLRTLQVLVGLYSWADAPLATRESMPPPRLLDITPSDLPPAIEAVPPTQPAPGAAKTANASPATPDVAPITGVRSASEDDRVFRETFARGTTAFVQRRYEEAADAFEACTRLRPNDDGAATMLRRSRTAFRG